MKYLGLVWAGLWRKPVRTVLAFLSVANACVLFTLLQGFSGGLASAVDKSNASVLVTGSRVSLVEPLPLGLRETIERAPGVTEASPILSFHGAYRDPKNKLRVFAVEPAAFARSEPDLGVTTAQTRALEQVRNGALVPEEVGQQYGWKVGDRIPLQSFRWINRDGTTAWPLEIVGFYPAHTGFFANSILVNFAFADEGRVQEQGTTSIFLVGSSGDPSSTAAAIDALSANSTHETKTVSERQMAQDSVAQLAQLDTIMRVIVAAIFFALIFSVGMVMMQALRERQAEFAVLKTLGFTDVGVLSLVLVETLTLCLSAAALGVTIAVLLFPTAHRITGFVVMIGPGLAWVFAVALLLALVTGLPPALRASRLQIAQALAGR